MNIVKHYKYINRTYILCLFVINLLRMASNLEFILQLIQNRIKGITL